MLPDDRKVTFTLAELTAKPMRLSTWEKLKHCRWHCVYLVRDEQSSLLYVGSTQHGPRSRMLQHMRCIRTPFDRVLREADVSRWTVDVYSMSSIDLARLVEAYAIANLGPRWNERVDGKAKVA